MDHGTHLYKSTFMWISVAGVNQDVATPRDIYKLLAHLFDVRGQRSFHDPCPLGGHQTDKNGLTTPWKKLNYVNPPFNEAAKWIRKARLEAELGNCTVLLMPARTHARYVQEEALPAADRILVLCDGVQFIGYPKTFAIPIMLLVFGIKAAKPSALIHTVSTDRCPPELVMSRTVPSYGVYMPDLTTATIAQWARDVWGPHQEYCIKSSQQLKVLIEQKSGPLNLFVIILGDNEACARELLEYNRRHPKATLVSMWMSRYQAAWFRLLVPHISWFLMLSRCLKLKDDHRGSMLGSFVAVLGPYELSRLALERAAQGPSNTVKYVRPQQDVTFLVKGSSYGGSGGHIKTTRYG